MAKPKRTFEIERYRDSNNFALYAVDLSKAVDTISDIEGISHISLMLEIGCVIVRCSPIYDRDEIIAEVEQLLSPVPDAFQEAMED